MPNTNPTVDTASDVEWVITAARRGGVVRVHPIGTITRGEKGQELSEMADMAQAGAVAFSDDGNMVKSARLMRNALAYSRVTGRPIVDHAEDPDLVDGGVMHEGRVASILGLRGAAAEAEEVAVARDIALARRPAAGCTWPTSRRPAAVDLVRAAKARGIAVTAEVTPHHLTDDRRVGRRAPASAARRSTRTAGSTRRCGPTPTARPCSKGCSTARSTASRPTTRRTPASTRTASSTRRRPGISCSRRRSGC